MKKISKKIAFSLVAGSLALSNVSQSHATEATLKWWKEVKKYAENYEDLLVSIGYMCGKYGNNNSKKSTIFGAFGGDQCLSKNINHPVNGIKPQDFGYDGCSYLKHVMPTGYQDRKAICDTAKRNINNSAAFFDTL